MSARQGCLVWRAHKGPFALCKTLWGVLMLNLGRHAGSQFPPLPRYICLDPGHSTVLLLSDVAPISFLVSFHHLSWSAEEGGRCTVSPVHCLQHPHWAQGQPGTEAAAHPFVTQGGTGPPSPEANTPVSARRALLQSYVTSIH